MTAILGAGHKLALSADVVAQGRWVRYCKWPGKEGLSLAVIVGAADNSHLFTHVHERAQAWR